MEKITACRFCEAARPLKQSHILPAFVLRWLKESTPGAIRFGETPNRRVQDGVKADFLCEECEQQFSVWEKAFAERIFLPFHLREADQVAIEYGDWALKFAVSVSWRVLTFYREIAGLGQFTEAQKQEAASAAKHWKDFLQGAVQNPGRFEQHVIPLDIIESFSGGHWSPFINRYLTRTVDMDVAASERSAFVYSKMGRLLLIGFISGQQRSEWKETRLHVREGSIGGVKQYTVPGNLMQFVNSKAERAAQRLASMSQKQTDLVQQSIREKVETGEILQSEIVQAMGQDVLLFGSEAFSVTSREGREVESAPNPPAAADALRR